MGATAGMGVMAGMSVMQARQQADAQQQQAGFAAQQYEQNSVLAEGQASDAIKRGEHNASAEAQKTKMNIGAQRAAAAASGVDVNSGSALDLQADTAGQGALNEMTLKNNAWREAWGYKVQANNASMSGQMALLAGGNQSRNTLLTGGMNAINYGTQAYGNYKKNND